MKRCIALVLVLTLLPLFLPAQTIDQTATWLRGKLLNSSVSFQIGGAERSELISAFGVSNGILNLTVRVTTFGQRSSDTASGTNHFALPLKKLSTRVVVKARSDLPSTVPQYPQLYSVSLETSSGEQLPYQVVTQYGSSVHRTSSVAIYLLDQELADRVAKAFQKLIELHGGEVEPF